tara:strand:- start:6675 stop:7841 length:1167 start_codon:yes stop_codon:yes gene_type:complete
MTKQIDCPLRIANIIEEGRIGGPQIRNLIVASELKKKINITLIFPKKNSSALKKKCNLIGVKFLSLSLTIIKKDFKNILLYLFFFPLEVVMLARTLKTNQFDLIHVSGGCWQCKGIFAAKLAGIKVIWELNDTHTPFIVRYAFFFLSSMANGFIFASVRTKKYYRKFLSAKQKSFIIQSPVDVNFFNPNLNYITEKFIKKKSKKKNIIIGTVANINPVKDLQVFLNVAKKLSSYSNQVIFIVVGAVYESQKQYFKYLTQIIKRLAIKNFFFLNVRKDIRPLLNAMDIYVCTSRNESSPLSVWEAMSMKKAIVSTDVGDVAKFINNGINGFVVKVGDINGLARDIKKLIDKPKLRDVYGKKSRKIAKKKLDLKICGNMHVVAYETIANC